MDKGDVIREARAALARELEAVERVAAMARDEVSSAESKQEGKYDTRATEASYLARGQAWRVAELRRLQAWFEVLEDTPHARARVGSLLQLDGPRPGWVLLAPIGGPQLDVGGVPVRVVSPSSPLGRALLGLEAGDGAEVDSPQGPVDYEVVALQ